MMKFFLKLEIFIFFFVTIGINKIINKFIMLKQLSFVPFDTEEA